jgi:hypothetical protein
METAPGGKFYSKIALLAEQFLQSKRQGTGSTNTVIAL